jgi:hypothetical protein
MSIKQKDKLSFGKLIESEFEKGYESGLNFTIKINGLILPNVSNDDKQTTYTILNKVVDPFCKNDKEKKETFDNYCKFTILLTLINSGYESIAHITIHDKKGINKKYPREFLVVGRCDAIIFEWGNSVNKKVGFCFDLDEIPEGCDAVYKCKMTNISLQFIGNE